MTATNTVFDVLCIGLATYDVVMTVDHHPEPDIKCLASGLLTAGGGPAANAAVVVARLGGKSAFAGYLGRDAFGEEHLQEFLQEGVDPGWIVRGSIPTPLSVVLVKPDGDRTVVCHKAQMPVLSAQELDFGTCHANVILADGHQPHLALAALRPAGGNRSPLVLDAGSVHAGALELLPHTDYLVASARFAEDFSGQADLRKALEVLRRHAPCVVITLGRDGLVWQNEAGAGSLPAIAVDAIDTTGAGDTFHGAFALALARGQDLPAALTYASAAAAFCCQKLGARPGAPTARELERFLQAPASYDCNG